MNKAVNTVVALVVPFTYSGYDNGLWIEQRLDKRLKPNDIMPCFNQGYFMRQLLTRKRSDDYTGYSYISSLQKFS